MFGPKIRNVFKSRWQALFWSASVLLTAYCSVPSSDGDDDSSVTKFAENVAARVGQQKTEHKNPWAKDPQSN
ncbi:hypothetical protein WBP06_14875 [Novosphingobium sp. BL-8H]|uniref:hypothetical protein n=1 Tax=Novosphingobium sp. BL-8H TaxID=3127640 RepID=UPI0037576ED6